MKQTEKIYLGRTNLQSGVAVRQATDFPLGQIWDALHLDLRGQIVVAGEGSGYAAFDNLMLELINKIQLKCDLDGIIYNIPAKAAYYLAAQKFGTLPRLSDGGFNPNTAGSYTISAHIPLIFTDKKMIRPEDTALDTARYSKVDLEIALGTAADLLKTTGSGMTFSLENFYVDLTLDKRARRESILPLLLPRYQVEETFKPSTNGTIINFERSGDTALKRFHLYASNCGTTVTPTRNWQGSGSNSIISKLSFKDEFKYYFKDLSDEQMLNDMKLNYGWDENQPEGLYSVDLCEDGSNASALSTGDKGVLAVEYEIDSAAPSGNKIISVVSERLVGLK